MGKIKNLMEDISAEAQYDENAKELLKLKPFLANILARTVEEFKDVDSKEIERLIEGEPQVGTVPVDPGFTNHKTKNGNETIIGMNVEDKIRKEGVRYYDILFYVRTKDGLATVIVNIEAQKKEPSEYDIEMRGIFYAARMISSQLNRDFFGKDYNGMRKVYSIWICLNCKENTINRIHLGNEEILGESRWKEMYDVINVEFVRLKDTLDENESHELHRLLGAMFLPALSMQEKEKIIENEFGIELEDKWKELTGTMCNLGEGIKEQALEEGRNEGKCRNLIELIIKKVRKSKVLYQIADELEESEEVIQPLYEAVLKGAPEYDIDKIYESIQNMKY